MPQWHLSYGGQQSGPMDQARAAAQARNNPQGYAWREGFTDWVPIGQIAELTSAQMSSPKAPPPPGGQAFVADEIDFKIYGEEMQFVEVERDPGESAVAEAGAMMYKDPSIVMATVLGDGSQSGAGGSFMDKLLGAGKRLLTGESLFMTGFYPQWPGKGPCRLRGALSRQYHPHRAAQCGRLFDLPERQFPLCRQRRFHRHLSATKNPDRPLRRRRLCNAETGGRRSALRARRRYRRGA